MSRQSYAFKPCSLQIVSQFVVGLSLLQCVSAGDGSALTHELRLDHNVGHRNGPYVARLVLENDSIDVGDFIGFTISVHNLSGKAVSFLNPSFSPLVPIGIVDFLIFDDRGVCVGEVYRLGTRDGSYQKLAPSHWSTISSDGLIRKTDKARISVVRDGTEQLKPGVYYLQMVFRDTFVSESPFANAIPPSDPKFVEHFQRWKRKHPGKEQFRSNAVEIVIRDHK